MGGPRARPVSSLPRLPRALAAAVNSYMKERRPLRAQCLLSSREFSGAITAGSRAGAEVTTTSRESHGPFTHCAYTMAGGGAGGNLYSIQQGAGVCLFSGEGGGFFGRAVRMAKRLRSAGVAAPFTESARIRDILADFEKGAGVQLWHKKSVRRAVGAAPRTTVEWDRPARGRRYKSVGEAFADADKSGMAIESLRAFTDKSGGPDVTVSRGGLVTVHAGDIRGVYDNVLRPIIGGGIDRRDIFSGRSRSERPDREPRPLLVEYKRPVLAGEGDRRRLCGLFERYPNCNYGIVHAGSSHVYISIVDRTDNSTVAVRSVGDSALAIIPQIRTTGASLLRLTAFLAAEFCEGAIGEYGR